MILNNGKKHKRLAIYVYCAFGVRSEYVVIKQQDYTVSVMLAIITFVLLMAILLSGSTPEPCGLKRMQPCYFCQRMKSVITKIKKQN